jgi:hypothetical protein
VLLIPPERAYYRRDMLPVIILSRSFAWSQVDEEPGFAAITLTAGRLG